MEPDILSAMNDAIQAPTMPARLYMVIEKFRDPAAVYRRFQERGRLAPEGLLYVSSWIDENVQRCFQLMETKDLRLLQEWMENWDDLVDFEVFPVISSQEAADKILAKR